MHFEEAFVPLTPMHGQRMHAHGPVNRGLEPRQQGRSGSWPSHLRKIWTSRRSWHAVAGSLLGCPLRARSLKRSMTWMLKSQVCHCIFVPAGSGSLPRFRPGKFTPRHIRCGRPNSIGERICQSIFNEHSAGVVPKPRNHTAPIRTPKPKRLDQAGLQG